MLFTIHGTTDMPIKGVIFATSSVEHFLEGVMKTDTQDFLGKIEEFEVQSIYGKLLMHTCIILIHCQLTYSGSKNCPNVWRSLHSPTFPIGLQSDSNWTLRLHSDSDQTSPPAKGLQICIPSSSPVH
jgi:hypothetical protein